MFKKGDNLICIRPQRSKLTLGEIYTALEDEDDPYICTTYDNDCYTSQGHIFFSNRFKLLELQKITGSIIIITSCIFKIKNNIFKTDCNNLKNLKNGDTVECAYYITTNFLVVIELKHLEEYNEDNNFE